MIGWIDARERVKEREGEIKKERRRLCEEVNICLHLWVSQKAGGNVSLPFLES